MNHFVFVVCGGKEHIDSLNFSLKFLKKFSQAKIQVITDLSRNEAIIAHENIIDVKTPEHYNHHEASIYLKTSLHRYLDMAEQNEFCYLDTDVVAVSSQVDFIFNEIPKPIRFAQDHDVFESFSPYATNCGCLEELNQSKHDLSEKLNQLNPDFEHENPYRQAEERKLMETFQFSKSKPLSYGFKMFKYFIFRFLIPVKTFRFSKDFSFDKKQLSWKNRTGKTISFDYPRLSKKLAKQYGILYDKKTGNWKNATGKDFFTKTIACSHLSNHIKETYKINIPSDWRHWNGGVFRFNFQSKDFLEKWHAQTIAEFNNPYTKTRDQAMLAVTAWQFGLQQMKTLPVKYNFITEYNNADVSWDSIKGYTYNGFKSTFKPVFLHIYHHWGDTNWSIWKSLSDL